MMERMYLTRYVDLKETPAIYLGTATLDLGQAAFPAQSVGVMSLWVYSAAEQERGRDTDIY